MIQINCQYDELLDIRKVNINPKNRNIHPKDQIQRLKSILEYQGFRHPLIISKNSGLLIVGNGRLEAAKKLKMKQVPVVYQEFIDSTQETAFGISDNSIASWAELDLSGINDDLQDLGPDFNLDNLGLKNFVLDVSEKEEEPEKPKKLQMLTCPNCQEEFEMQQAPKRYV